MSDWMKYKGIKFAGRNINNLKYAYNSNLISESEE